MTWIECEVCVGTGRYGFRDDDTCPVCHGGGSVEAYVTARPKIVLRTDPRKNAAAGRRVAEVVSDFASKVTIAIQGPDGIIIVSGFPSDIAWFNQEWERRRT